MSKVLPMAACLVWGAVSGAWIFGSSEADYKSAAMAKTMKAECERRLPRDQFCRMAFIPEARK